MPVIQKTIRNDGNIICIINKFKTKHRKRDKNSKQYVIKEIPHHLISDKAGHLSPVYCSAIHILDRLLTEILALIF